MFKVIQDIHTAFEHLENGMTVLAPVVLGYARYQSMPLKRFVQKIQKD